MRSAVRSVLSAALLGAGALLAGCATTPVTTLEVSWVTPQLPQAPLKKVLIITVASSEFVQIAFQDQMAARLQAHGVNAVASRRYFTRYTDAERARFRKSIEESDAEFVLLARVTNTQTTTFEDRGTIIGPNGVPYADATGVYSAYARYAYPGSYVQGADASTKTITAEASIFAAKGEKLMWSARTRTTNAHSTTGEGFAPQYVAVILDAMKKDKLFP
ncbi:MAG TPA: hypothetical protein VFC18_01775 [Burkholderiales bacterium]|nr:hypothetical protein [Burkholderiales bacterium]